MAALTESGLRNVPYGDRDSVGYFQMRLSVWDIGPYQGYRHNPRLQIQWFIDHALAVREQDPAVAENPSTGGEWVADVEQPATQYRFRYQLQLQSANALLHGVNLDQIVPEAPPPATSVGQTALQVALHEQGVPYQWGGSSPATGLTAPASSSMRTRKRAYTFRGWPPSSSTLASRSPARIYSRATPCSSRTRPVTSTTWVCTSATGNSSTRRGPATM